VVVYRYQGPAPAVQSIPDDYRFPSMGDATTVRKQISAAVSSVDWADPAWGILEDDGYSIEINIKGSGPIDSFMLHVRGGGDPVSVIARLCQLNGWVALDTSAGEFMDLNAPSHDGWRQFQAFRDQVLAAADSAARTPWYKRLLRALKG